MEVLHWNTAEKPPNQTAQKKIVMSSNHICNVKEEHIDQHAVDLIPNHSSPYDDNAYRILSLTSKLTHSAPQTQPFKRSTSFSFSKPPGFIFQALMELLIIMFATSSSNNLPIFSPISYIGVRRPSDVCVSSGSLTPHGFQRVRGPENL